jgi:hypothetical protein
MRKAKAAGAKTVAPVKEISPLRYRLRDQDTGFYDSETGLKVVRDDVVEIDLSKRVGKLTTGAIRAGRLIEVNLEPAKSEKEQETETETG